MIEVKCSKCDCVGTCSEGSRGGPWLGNDGMCDSCGPCGNCGKHPSGQRAIRLGLSKLLIARIIYDNTVSEFTRGIPFDCTCLDTFFDEDELRKDLFGVLICANIDNHEKEVEQVCALYAMYIDYPKILIHLKEEKEDYGSNDDNDDNDFENDFDIPFFEQMQSKYSADGGGGQYIKG